MEARRPVEAAQPSGRVAEALDVVETANRDARRARERAEALLAVDAADEAACIALRARGLAEKVLGDLTASRKSLREAVALGERRGFTLRTAQARTSLIIALAEFGNTKAALAQAALAEAELLRLPPELSEGEHELARLRVNVGVVYYRIGRYSEAVARVDPAEPVLRRRGDSRWLALMLNMRGSAHAHQGEHRAAEADLKAAEEVAGRGGFQTLRQAAVHNRGFAAMRAGDLPRALRTLDRALELAAQVGKRPERILSDRAEALLAAGLAQEALACAMQAAEGHEQHGFVIDASEARLSAARAALADGDFERAVALAETAGGELSRQRRPGWAAFAGYVEHSARFAAGERSLLMLRGLQRNATVLERAGWEIAPVEAALAAARTAAALGRWDTAARLYTRAAQARGRGPAYARIIGWQAEAALRESHGDLAGAGRAVSQGLREVARYAGTFGATEMRAGASMFGSDLAETGLRLALGVGAANGAKSTADPVGAANGGARNGIAATSKVYARRVLLRAEQFRATSLLLRPVRPPEDAKFAEQLIMLRTINVQITKGGLDGHDVRGLHAQRRHLEEEVQRLARHAEGGGYSPPQALDLKELVRQLDDRVLVEYVRCADELHAVTVADGRAVHHRLGSYQVVLAELDQLRFVIGRMARGYGNKAMQAAALDGFEFARARLDEILLGPLARRLGDRPAVLVPTGSLHALAWPVLPSLEGRPVSVAPSAVAWLKAQSAWASAAPGKHVLACGPDLKHGQAEVAEVAECYPGAEALTGPAATAKSVAAALDGAAVAHIAAHGRFRSDNPLFSSLELADGQLTVYEFERLSAAPGVLVLSACDSALSGIKPGDELMGVSSAVFALGTRTLISSVAPVGDQPTRELMVLLHAELARGATPAAALAAAQCEVPEARGFICFGAG
jgi:tetratricopeptide (TPR) repeat protein